MDGVPTNSQPQSRHPTTPSPSGMMPAQGNYPTPPSPHMHPAAYKGVGNAIGPGAPPMANTLGQQQAMPPYGNQSQQQQFSQGSYSARPQYPGKILDALISILKIADCKTNKSIGIAGGMPPHANHQNQYPGRPMPNQVPPPPHQQFPGSYQQQTWNPASGQANLNHIPSKNGPSQTSGGSPRPLNQLKQHLLHKGGYGQSPTSPQSYVNGPGMHQPMGPPQMQPIGSHQVPPRLQVSLHAFYQ